MAIFVGRVMVKHATLKKRHLSSVRMVRIDNVQKNNDQIQYLAYQLEYLNLSYKVPYICDNYNTEFIKIFEAPTPYLLVSIYLSFLLVQMDKDD